MVKDLLKFVWKNNLKENFLNGRLIYERQLQALLYHYLKTNLESKYHVWIEPTTYFKEQSENSQNIEKSKPDIIITDDVTSAVVAILELKFKPWELVDYADDLWKLNYFSTECVNGNELRLGWKPVSPIWREQKKVDSINYRISEATLLGFLACGRPESKGVSPIPKVPNNFIHLVGYIDKSECSIFKEIKY